MKTNPNKRITGTLALGLLLSGVAVRAQNPPTDPGWPRRYSNGGAEVVVYNPQIDAWSDFKILRGRCAFALRAAAGRDPVYGTFRFEGNTLVDPDRKVVLLRDLRAFDMRFPSAPGGASPAWAELTKSVLPADAMVLSLDRILAYMKANEVPSREARVRTEPPPILVSTQPAVLVILDGSPVMLEVENTGLRRVLNTNWDLYEERRSGHYFLRDGKSWLVAAELHGNYARATELPADFGRLPAPPDSPDSGGASRSTSSPRVTVVEQPSELIVIQGQPELAPVSGQLSYVANTASDLFFDAGSRSYYFLASGRWFRSPGLQGPWQYASLTLPADFKRIPPEHPKARVLAAVPGTREAEDAVLLAAVPRTAEISRNDVTAEVQYVGAPQFESISGTSIAYAKNTPSDVLRVGDRYFLCFQGVWFVAASPNGPWKATDKVPSEIYSIPESSSKYHVTYVKVYESSPTTIVVGYTPGYYGAYVAGGVVVWGTGYYYPPYVAVGVTAVPVYWGAPCYTYGAAAWYNPATGVYARGAVAYGPYGGYGAAGAAYNPRTGTYAQGVAASGPYGSAAAGRTYNPYTGVASAGYSASNAYGSWGQGAVSNGSSWAKGGYQSGSKGTVAAGQTSAGGAGAAWETANGKTGYVGKSASGDVYAGANGNVYKRDNGQWYQNQNGSWNTVDKNTAAAQNQQAAARDRGTRNAQASEASRPQAASAGSGGRSGSFGANRPSGGTQRPQMRGRGR